MNPGELQQILDGAFDLWAQMTGFDASSRRWSGLQTQAKELQEARRLDDSGVTAFMLLKAFTQRYIEEEQVSAMEVIRGFTSEKQRRLDLLRDMLLYLERPEIDVGIERFMSDVRTATAHYGVDHEDLEAWIGNYYWLAVLRRDARRSYEQRLEAHQFYHGQPASEDTPVVYGTKVLEFWNIPSLVRAMLAMGKRGLRGVNLCLIRDPFDALFSYFVIAVVNGESLVMLTDREKQAHPMAKFMARRPDKRFIERAETQWFPYELLKLKTEAGEKLYAAERTQLVPVNAEAVELADFSSLHPADVIWLSLLFRLIADEYLIDNKRLPETSFTHEMIKSPELLLAARPEIVQHSTYAPLVVPELTLADVSTEATRGQWKHHPVGHNEWMLERYSAQVPLELLNVTHREDLQGLPEGTMPKLKLDRWEAKREDRFRTMDPLGFGTRTEVERDRIWNARYNLCLAVQRRADVEHHATRETVLAWYKAKVRTRVEWLARRSLEGPFEQTRLSEFLPFGQEQGVESYNMLETYVGLWNHRKGSRYGDLHIEPAERTSTGVKWPCALTSTKETSYHAIFSPWDAAGIAALLGVLVAELPWQLQVWCKVAEPRYSGNHLLDRLDPADWALTNPWSHDNHRRTDVNLGVVVHLSRRVVNKLQAELGLEAIDWQGQAAKDKKVSY